MAKPKAAQNLAHVYKRVADAHKTLADLVRRTEASQDSSSTGLGLENRIEELEEKIKVMKAGDPDAKWGSFPKRIKTKKKVEGKEYKVEQYEYATAKHPAGTVESVVLKQLNMLLGRYARNQAFPGGTRGGKKVVEIPAYVKEHAELLGAVVRDMDKVRGDDPAHPYNSRRTRSK